MEKIAEFLMALANMVSFFAAVLCVAAWYNAIVAIYREAPLVVTRLPVALGLLAVIAGKAQGWIPGPGPAWVVVTFAGTALAASFVLCFFYGWVRRAHLDHVERARFSPVMYAWTAGLLLQLAVTALNGAQWGVARPFYIHV
jgi:hypothetical protein